jgi:hypothetical protein
MVLVDAIITRQIFSLLRWTNVQYRFRISSISLSDQNDQWVCLDKNQQWGMEVMFFGHAA